MRETPYDNHDNGPARRFHIAIVGAGISGLCLGIRLKMLGIDNFIILEKSDDVGGTWLDNSYPGCGCDVPSILYSFSFAPNGKWSRKYAPQDEILEYFRDCADRYDIRSHIRFGVSVNRAEWREEQCDWIIATDNDTPFCSDIFVSAVGQLSRPSIPDIEGTSSFRGSLFHSACWDHSFNASGKNVGVIGNGASAIQIIPQLARIANQVTVFQRSPNWILPRHDHRYGSVWRLINRLVPFAARLQRFFMYIFFESRIIFYKRRTFFNRAFTGWARFRMRQVAPPELYNKLIPSFPAGAKRVLLSNNYLQCLHQKNVEVVTDEIDRITPDGIEAGGRTIPLEGIICATGFEASRFLYPIEVVGRHGVSLSSLWERRPTTYLGMLVPGFPNFVMLYGPNTNLGHNSIIFMVECQVRYLLKLRAMLSKEGGGAFEVREEAAARFDRQLQKHLDNKVWGGYVANWYTNKHGDVTNNWCGSTLAYMWQTRRVEKTALQFSRRPCSTSAEPTPTAR